MFAMVAAVGIRTLHKASFKDNHNMLIVAVSLSFGMIPTVAPTFYHNFPNEFQVIFGSGITATVIAVFILNLVFNHWIKSPKAGFAGEHLPQYGAEVDVTAGEVAEPKPETYSTPDKLVEDDPIA
jgi:uric acid transporter